METIFDAMTTLSMWHWLAIGLIMLGIEAALGTFDLLWIAIAAGLTAMFTALAPELASGWQAQFMFFAVASVLLIVLGRTVFAGMRKMTEEHPTLNKRMDSLVGRRGIAATDFEAGLGRVKIGDTEWSAELAGDGVIRDGDGIVVEATAGNVVKVRKG
ncbi:MAG: NfeD family protein [Pseudomonadota bacterium]